MAEPMIAPTAAPGALPITAPIPPPINIPGTGSQPWAEAGVAKATATAAARVAIYRGFLDISISSGGASIGSYPILYLNAAERKSLFTKFAPQRTAARAVDIAYCACPTGL